MNSQELQLIDPTDGHILPKKTNNSHSMPPPQGQPRKKPRVVLSEEEYIEALGELVERDYFPDNAVMRQQLAWFSEGIGSKKNSMSTPHAIRLTDLRGAQYDDDMKSVSSSVPILNMTIGEFFARYTSEDNNSFEKIREKDMEDFKKKYHWAYEPLENDKASGYLMLYHMGGKELSGKERNKMDQLLDGPRTIGDDRPGQINTWRFKVRNNLLFPPELENHCSTADIGKGYHTSSSQSLLLTDGTNVTSALPDNKAIVPAIENGRVGSAPRSEKAIIQQNTRFQPLAGSEPSVSPLEHPHTPTTVSSETSDFENRRSGEYRTVSMTPSPMPTRNIANNLITWGTVFGTPIEIDEPMMDAGRHSVQSTRNNPGKCLEYLEDGNDDFSSRFQIKDMTQRDKLSRELDRRSRKSTKNKIYTNSQFHTDSEKSSAHTSRRGSSIPMSPAAMALARRLNGSTRSNGLEGAIASDLRGSYKRTPKSQSRTAAVGSAVTPIIKSTCKKVSIRSNIATKGNQYSCGAGQKNDCSSSSVTDGLLNL